MESKLVRAAMGEAPFDLAVRNVRLVNVFTQEIYPADIGVVGDTIAFAGSMPPERTEARTVDAGGLFAVPGFIDSHMHIESSMMTPAAFAEAVVPLGTTTVAADPHEIANVLGAEGVRMLCDMSRNLPLQVHVMAPSTVPSAPGYETSGADIGPAQVKEMLDYPGVLGLGEVMDFLGVIGCDERMLGIIAEAKSRGVLLDGHVPTLRGRELQAFISTGIDCDHTYMSPDIIQEKLRCGMCVQIQERFFTPELMAYLNACPVQNRIMLATDDVPITRLAARGHLDGLLRRAVALGLEPLKAVRYVTINAADRLRLYRQGAISPGRRADMLLLSSLEEVAVEQVYTGGRLVAEAGRMLKPLPIPKFPRSAYDTMRLSPLGPEDFAIPCGGKRALVNAIRQDSKTSRTGLSQKWCEVRGGLLRQGSLVKMAVFERHSGAAGRSLGLLDNLEEFRGAMAATYGHDCHNLTVYSRSDGDAVLAANTVIAMGGGVSAVLDGEVLCAIPLPIAGILCEDRLEELADKFAALEEAARRMRLNHEEVLTFLTLMPLAVSPEVKLTDRGILDVASKRFLPLTAEIREGEGKE